MKILFNDILSQCVVSANNTDTNFPISNLAHPFLRRRWQSTSNTDVITIESLDAANITSIYTAYTNATSISVVFFGVDVLGYNSVPVGYDGFGVALNSANAGVSIPIDQVLHNDTIFTKIEITLTAPVGEKVYLGKVAIGVDYEVDPPESFWEEMFEDNSILSVSQAGQVLQEYNEPLRVWGFRVPTLERDEAREFQDQYQSAGVGKPLFVDPMTDDLPVLYCRMASPLTVSKNKRQYAASINFTEAR